MKRFKYCPKSQAELSLQFYRDKEGTPNFLVTSNINKTNWPMSPIEPYMFGRNFAELEMLTTEEKLKICTIFITAQSILKGEKS